MSFKSWSSICVPWSEGGFQIKDISSWNKATLLKWLWHIDRGTGSIWCNWIRSYFLVDTPIWSLQIKEFHPESLRSILKVRDMGAQQLGGIHKVQDLLLSCSTPRGFCISKAYEVLRPKLPPLQCYKAVNSGCLLPRHKVVLMLAVQGKLATTDLLMARGIPIPNRCSLCREAAESSHHLFFQCSYSKALLLRVNS
ncbi:uncharacterized protein LOC141618632 [Silene latifolia]|uniref:uncharacterized protein LOC141618632 n=1 Tax=Silene latifolia TaxID=37657 RepID=UPI003D784545